MRERSESSGHSCALVYIRGFSLIDFLEPALEQEGRGDRGEFAGFLIRAIGEIRGSNSLRPEQPLAVTPATWSAAGGRGYIAHHPDRSGIRNPARLFPRS